MNLNKSGREKSKPNMDYEACLSTNSGKALPFMPIEMISLPLYEPSTYLENYYALSRKVPRCQRSLLRED